MLHRNATASPTARLGPRLPPPRLRLGSVTLLVQSTPRLRLGSVLRSPHDRLAYGSARAPHYTASPTARLGRFAGAIDASPTARLAYRSPAHVVAGGGPPT